MSKRETAIAALMGGIVAALPSAVVQREADAPSRVTDGGHVVIRDGEPGDPDVTLGVLSYWWTHSVDVEVYAKSVGSSRFQAVDGMLLAIDAALNSDRTLGGIVDNCTWRIDQLADAGGEGAETIRSALINVTISYQTNTPLG